MSVKSSNGSSKTHNESLAIEAHLDETRSFEPPASFVQQANINDPSIYQTALNDTEAFWESKAQDLDWFEPWHTVLEWKSPHAKWFLGGRLNV